MTPAAFLAVGAQQSHPVGKFRVGGDDGTTVSPAAEILGRIEAEASEITDSAGTIGADARAVCLTRVLHDRDPRDARERGHRLHVDGGPVEVHGDHTPDLGIERGCDALRGDQAGGRIDVDESGCGADQSHGLRGRDERVGGDEHLVAGAHLERAQRQHESLGPGGDADRVRSAAEPREVLLEPLDRVTEREGRAARDIANRVHQLLEQLGVSGIELDEGNRGLGRMSPARCRVGCWGAHAR